MVFGIRTSSICPGLGGGGKVGKCCRYGLENLKLQHLGFVEHLRVLRWVVLTGVPCYVSLAFLWDLRVRGAVQQASETGVLALACSAASESNSESVVAHCNHGEEIRREALRHCTVLQGNRDK